MSYTGKYTGKYINISIKDFENCLNVSDTVEFYASKISRHNYKAKGKMSRKLASYSNLVDSFFSRAEVLV
jgi:hypothetical protein